MKKITALICVIALSLTVLCACGKPHELVPIDDSANVLVTGAYKIKPDKFDDETTSAVVKAYNGAGETEEEAENVRTYWSIAVVAETDPSGVFLLKYIGNGQFNVSATPNNKETFKYKITCPELFEIVEPMAAEVGALESTPSADTEAE